MDDSNEALIAGAASGNARALGRLITLCENRVPRSREVLSALYERGGKAHIVGVTGAPGAGKSTLVDKIAAHLLRAGKKVAVLAVDPSSPFSGGAVLGDRIRMFDALDAGPVFMRSMATRGALGGISNGTVDAVHVLDAAQFDYIFIETVGVGQAEVDISRTADTCLVVLVPGMGDGVQVMKAGILEIADLFLINKADRDGVDLLEKEIKTLLSLVESNADDWESAVSRTVATDARGIEEVVKGMEAHREWLSTSERGKLHREFTIRERIIRICLASLHSSVIEEQSSYLDELAKQCLDRKIDPHAASEALIARLSGSKKKR